MRFGMLILFLGLIQVCAAATWVTFGTNRYYYSKDNGDTQRKFDDAEARCKELGAHLASVESKAENLFIFNLNPSLKGTRWVGGHRNRSGLLVKPYSWYWTDGKPFTIFNDYVGCTPDVDCLWQLGDPADPDPNDLGGIEDCTQMGQKDYAKNAGCWNDANCNNLNHFVCKRPVVYCGNQIENLDAHAVGNCASASKADGSNCTVACQTGYTVKQGTSPDFYCNATGNWEGNLICSPKDCGALAGLAANTQANCSATTFGTYCNATCSAGYNQVTGTNSTYYCNANGNWTFGNIQCTPKDCGALTGLSFATASCSSTTFGSTCKASCITGYKEASSSISSYVCSSSGKWSTGNIQCVPKDCGALTGLKNASASCSSTTFGSSCNATCNSGYVEDSSSDNSYVCDSTGKWSSGNIVCNIRNCGSLVLTEAQGTCSSTTFQSTCQATCKAGFDFVAGSDDSYVCGANGTWIDGNIGCKRKVCTSNPTGVTSLASTNCAGKEFDSVCTATCNLGYIEAVGSDATYRCNETAQWSDGNIKCEPVSCGNLVVSHATATCLSTDFLASCNATCINGYAETPLSDSSYVCGSQGKWISGDMRCVPMNCGPLINLRRATAQCADTLYGANCSASCLPGYNETSASVRNYTCDANGIWSSGNIVCEPIECGPINGLETVNAFSTCPNTRYKVECFAHCMEGHIPASSPMDSSYRCKSNGQWDYGAVACVPVDCGPLSGLANATASCPLTTFGESCVASCNAGYEQTLASIDAYTCDEFGYWSGGDMKCVRKNCGDLTGLSNAKTSCNSSLFGDTCVSSCNAGYYQVANTNATFVCGSDGVWSTSGLSLECNLVDCGALPTTSQGSSNCATSTFGTTCSVNCDLGFMKSPTTLNSYTCAQSGAWVGNASCIAVDCGALTGLSNATALCSSTGYLATCTATCDAGYREVTGSDPSYQCNKNGIWNNGKILCEKIVCPETIPGLPVGASSNCSGSNDPGSRCSASCSKNSLGSGIYTCGSDGVWTGGCGFNCTEWEMYNGNLYYYSENFQEVKLSFSDAENRCKQFGAHLASVHSKDENNYIFNLYPLIKGVRWLGGYRDRAGLAVKPYSWFWTDGSTFDIFPSYDGCTPGVDCLWEIGIVDDNDPNDLNGKEDCIQMGQSNKNVVAHNASWNDALCGFSRAFVCKMPIPVVDPLSCSSSTSATVVANPTSVSTTGAQATTTTTTAATTKAASTTTTTLTTKSVTTLGSSSAGTSTTVKTTTATTTTTVTTTTQDPCGNYELIYQSNSVSGGQRIQNSFDSTTYAATSKLVALQSTTSFTDFINIAKCGCTNTANCKFFFVQITVDRYYATYLTESNGPSSSKLDSLSYARV